MLLDIAMLLGNKDGRPISGCDDATGMMIRMATN